MVGSDHMASRDHARSTDAATLKSAATVAALYVEEAGSYFGLASVDPWDEARDARLYAGPHPVVAHPPCQRWGKLWAGQPLHIKLTGQRKTKGDDGGWIAADFVGGWTCCVEQGRYGHYARKPTLLYAVGCELPSLDWGIGEPRLDPAVIERMGLKRAKRLGEVGARGGGTDSTPRIHTPEAFRDLLLSIARSAALDARAAA